VNLSNEICHSLCDGFSVREVPVGFAIKSPFDWFMGEPLTFYARVENGRARYEDSGVLIADLEGMGVDFESESRRAVLDSLLQDHDVHYDENDMMFVTDWVAPSRLAGKTASFLSFLSRVQDLLFLNRDTVVSTFREDLLAAITERFQSRASIDVGVAPIPELPQSIVDISIRLENGTTLAVFPAVSELKALHAMLFAAEIESHGVEGVEPFLVFENFDASKVTQNTRARALNSNLHIAAWNGGRSGVLDKLDRFAGGVH
jgi:hypothetical protein